MRVFGLLNELLAWQHPQLLFTMTIPTHVDRGFPFHVFYHLIKRLGFRGMDKLIATTQATRGRLLSLGMPPEKVTVIPWSTNYRTMTGGVRGAASLRQRLGIHAGTQVVLWSGPLQDTGIEELQYCLRIAESVLARSDQYYFVFALKPGTFKTYNNVGSHTAGLSLFETDRSTFTALQDVADLFFSPICRRNRTVAPPLTWIEMMQRSVPVLTTDVDGVDEIIEHNQTGIVVDGITDTVNFFVTLNPIHLREMGKRAQHAVNRRYRLDNIVEAYVNLWNTGLGEKRQRRRWSSRWQVGRGRR
jgi:glycosyltransferase involved in cell wall biosynthesis